MLVRSGLAFVENWVRRERDTSPDLCLLLTFSIHKQVFHHSSLHLLAVSVSSRPSILFISRPSTQFPMVRCLCVMYEPWPGSWYCQTEWSECELCIISLAWQIPPKNGKERWQTEMLWLITVMWKVDHTQLAVKNCQLGTLALNIYVHLGMR